MNIRLLKSIEIIEIFQKNLLQKQLLKPHQQILLAFSGGQDSVLLVFFIKILQKQWKWSIHIIWCNHLLQIDSLYIFLHISNLSYNLQIPLSTSIFIENFENENAIRNIRYEIFFRVSSFKEINNILVGHNSSDRLETLFINIFRGTGSNSFYFINWKKQFVLKKDHPGFKDLTLLKKKLYFQYKTKNHIFKKFFIKKQLNSIKPNLYQKLKTCKKNLFFKEIKKENIKLFRNHQNFLKNKKDIVLIIRPLLSLTRYEIKIINITYQTPIFPDKTNQKQIYTRNRIRNQLVPTLRFFFNPQIDNLFFQYNEIGYSEENFFEFLTKKIYLQIKYQNELLISINVSILKKLPISIQRRIVHRLLEKILKKKIQFSYINYLINLYKKNRPISSKMILMEKKISNKKFLTCLFFPKIGLIFIGKNTLYIKKFF